MFKFKCICELFAIETRVSKKNNNTYTVMTVLAENGKTVDVMYTGQALNYAVIIPVICCKASFIIGVSN